MTAQERITLLEQFSSPEGFAFSQRSDGNNLTINKFQRNGGERTLKYAKWNIKAIEQLSQEEFDKILTRVKTIKHIYEAYKKDMPILDFLRSLSPGNNKE